MTVYVALDINGDDRKVRLLQHFAKGIPGSRTRSVSELLRRFPDDAEAIVLFGILRGGSDLIRLAEKRGIDYYYGDHAYMKPDREYTGRGWFRFTKNGHSMTRIESHSSDRYDEFFRDAHPIEPWRGCWENGRVLLAPATPAIRDLFPAEAWEDDVRDLLFWRDVNVRTKQSETPVRSDLNDASFVVAYNSVIALEATLAGLPVHVSDRSCCHPVSQDIELLLTGRWEYPDRRALVSWLACCQFSWDELGDGTAWEMLTKQGGDK